MKEEINICICDVDDEGSKFIIPSKDPQVVYLKLKFFNNMKIFNSFERCNFDIINSANQDRRSVEGVTHFEWFHLYVELGCRKLIYQHSKLLWIFIIIVTNYKTFFCFGVALLINKQSLQFL